MCHWNAAATAGSMLVLFFTIIALIYIGAGFVGSSEEHDDYHLRHINNIYLWTRQSQIVAEELSMFPEHSISDTRFSPYLPTYIITHGFLSSALYNWVIILKDALLGREDCNVLAISWESGSFRLSYYVVQGRVPEVGQEVADVIQLLRDAAGLNLELLHLIGHSLGAHVSGFAGKHFNGSIARITGLDPAGMGFNSAAPEDRLDKNDAQFVDVIHTQACTTLIQTYTCLGIASSIGDVDIWVNGGEQQQACEEGGDGDRVLEDGSPCSHSMSYVYYTESIDYPPSSTRYLARSCPSKEHYHNGSCSCSRYPQYLGINTNQRTEGDFYVNTSATWPYAVSDNDCPAAAYTLLQVMGLALLCCVLMMTATGLCIMAWLHYHPEDQEYLSSEFLLAVTEVILDYCQEYYDRLITTQVTWLTNIRDHYDK